MNDPYGENVDPPTLTTVSLFLGDCSDDRLLLVCEGTSTLYGEATWQRVAHALRHPSPRGPYPVSSAFAVFVHNTTLADSTVLSTLRVDVVCKDGFAYASVQNSRSQFDLDPVPVVIGDDVVTIARKSLHLSDDLVTVRSFKRAADVVHWVLQPKKNAKSLVHGERKC